VHLFNLLLVGSLSFVDGENDVVAVSLSECDVSERLLDGEVNVARLEVMVVDLDSAGHGAGLRVNEPGRLPFAAPEGLEVHVDAADIDLQVAILVEAHAGASCLGPVVLRNVGINGSLDSSLVGRPLLVEFLREVALTTEHSRNHGVRVERELDAKFGIEVDEGGARRTLLSSSSVLATNLGHHSDASIRELDVLLVQLKVFLEGVLDVLVLQDLAINDGAQIFEHHVDFTD